MTTYQNLSSLLLSPSRYLRISSKDRTVESDSTCDFKVNIKQEQKLLAVKGVMLSHVSFPNMFYTVQDDLKFVFNWDDVGATPPADVTVTILQDNYNITTLMTHLEQIINTELQLVSANWEITVSELNGRLVFTSTGSAPGTLAISKQGDQINELLGITYLDNLEPSQSPYMLSASYNIFGVKDVVVTSNVLSDMIGTIESNNKFLASVAHVSIESASFGEWVVYKTSVPELESRIYNRAKDISSIDIQMRDDDGKILALDGLHWEIVFKFYF